MAALSVICLAHRVFNFVKPAAIASFGAGDMRISIRIVAPLGAAAYAVAVSTDLRARKTAGTQLLHNPQITVSATAPQATR